VLASNIVCHPFGWSGTQAWPALPPPASMRDNVRPLRRPLQQRPRRHLGRRHRTVQKRLYLTTTADGVHARRTLGHRADWALPASDVHERAAHHERTGLSRPGLRL
jgi:hypothetical protein